MYTIHSAVAEELTINPTNSGRIDASRTMIDGFALAGHIRSWTKQPNTKPQALPAEALA
jgi:hypothetical protein